MHMRVCVCERVCVHAFVCVCECKCEYVCVWVCASVHACPPVSVCVCSSAYRKGVCGVHVRQSLQYTQTFVQKYISHMPVVSISV